MTNNDLEIAFDFVQVLFRELYGREPSIDELETWAAKARSSATLVDLFLAFVESPGFRARHAVKPYFPAGHYHSPIVDPADIEPAYSRSRERSAAEIRGIELDITRMEAFWDSNASFMRTTPFTEEPHPENRFFYRDSPYPWGDAILLRAMIAAYRPSRIIEVGSGFSTACMLDAADHCGLVNLAITCIEPYTMRLRQLLRPKDLQAVTIIEKRVQDVALDMFDSLSAGDILFIDSTHVLKSGSDVQVELFDIMPRLRKGVLVHVHDCPFPFEYPPKWVMERNYSWNEVYALRAFLMYNSRFSVFFWNSLFARSFRPKIAIECPDFLRNPGSAIWLEVNS